jgi:hypothetical protein
MTRLRTSACVVFPWLWPGCCLFGSLPISQHYLQINLQHGGVCHQP